MHGLFCTSIESMQSVLLRCDYEVHSEAANNGEEVHLLTERNILSAPILFIQCWHLPPLNKIWHGWPDNKITKPDLFWIKPQLSNSDLLHSIVLALLPWNTIV